MTIQEYNNKLDDYTSKVKESFYIQKDNFKRGLEFDYEFDYISFFDSATIESKDFYSVNLDEAIGILQDFKKELESLGLSDKYIRIVEALNYDEYESASIARLKYVCTYDTVIEELNYDEIYSSFVDNVIRDMFEENLNYDNLELFRKGYIDWDTLVLITDGAN